MELGLLAIFGGIQVAGLLVVLITGQFEANINELANEQNLDLSEKTQTINKAGESILNAVESIAGISGALALAVFVISVMILFYAIWGNFGNNFGDKLEFFVNNVKENKKLLIFLLLLLLVLVYPILNKLF